MSTIEVNKIAPVSGGTTVQVGESGNTINIPSGATITNSGTANNFTSYRPNAKPLIINGDMQVAQRSTSVSTTAGGYKTVDRLQFNTSSTTGNATFTQENDAPSNTGFRKSMKITPNATETMSGSKNILFTYALEGQDVQVLQHGSASPPKATLSFWVKSNKTGAYSVQVKEETIANESYVLFEYTISQADTWEQKVFSWTGNSAHTLNNDNTMGFRLCWHLASGSDDHASATTSWVVESTYKTTANQVNFFDSTSNTWYITGIQLEVGEYTSSTLPPFQHESFGDNLARCQRYFQKVGATVVFANHTGGTLALGATNIHPMRANPTASTTGTLTVNDNGVQNFTQSSSDISLSDGNNEAIEFSIGNFSGMTNRRVMRLREGGEDITLSAEL
jgi:hypothetical protein